MESIKETLLTGVTYKFEFFRNGVLDESMTEVVHNLTPIEGLNYMLASAIKGSTSPLTAWYIAPYEGNYTPQTTDTAANIVANATECTTYAESTRVVFTPGAIASGAMDNTASLATFTFNATKTIYGGFMTSSATKSSTTGVLISAVRFTSPKSVDATTVLKVTAGFQMASA